MINNILRQKNWNEIYDVSLSTGNSSLSLTEFRDAPHTVDGDTDGP